MAKTINDLVAEARDLLQDTRDTSYRHSNAKIMRLINTALREVKRIRPDAFVGCCSSDGTTMPDYDEATLAEVPQIDFPIDEQFYQAVIFHVVAVAELSEDEFVQEGRAATLMAAFKQQLLGA